MESSRDTRHTQMEAGVNVVASVQTYRPCIWKASPPQSSAMEKLHSNLVWARAQQWHYFLLSLQTSVQLPSACVRERWRRSFSLLLNGVFVELCPSNKVILSGQQTCGVGQRLRSQPIKPTRHLLIPKKQDGKSPGTLVFCYTVVKCRQIVRSSPVLYQYRIPQ